MLRHMKFGQGDKKVALLVPNKDFNRKPIIENYINPLQREGVPSEQVIAFNLEHNAQGKVPIASIAKPWLENLEKLIAKSEITHVLVCEGNYFKTLAKVGKVDRHYGYALPTNWQNKNGDVIHACICPNYQALFYNPGIQNKIDLALKGLARHVKNKASLFSGNLTANCAYPGSPNDIAEYIRFLHTHPALTCDIEAYSLKVDEAGLASISFSWNETNSVAFLVGKNEVTRKNLRNFFLNYKGKLIFHNAPYDAKVLIWNLFMQHPRDYDGMLQGLHVLFRDCDDTKILAYLALNTTADISLSLKDLGFEFAGNYALEDIHDITKIPLDQLLGYNSIDTMTTWYVHNKYRDQVRLEQEHVYQEVFRPALKVITQMELCGMPMNFGRVLRTEQQLDDIARTHLKSIKAHPFVIAWEDTFRDQLAEKANAKLKRIRKSRVDFLHESFNPGSHLQVADLLYSYLGLPVLDTTDKGNPATGAKTLSALRDHLHGRNRVQASRETQETIRLLEDMIEWNEVVKILNTFIPAFKNSTIEKDGWHYLHGGFNLGGTKSGRLSSSNPNLQNLPSTGTKYAKLVKECFMAPPYATEQDPYGWLMVGADFSSLEDRISALLTKDPNKLKIYTDGYDGHCLRAYSYFRDQMPDIDPDSVSSVNSIAQKYPDLRQASKSPTFLLTYMGTAKGLMRTFGFSADMAAQIEKNYHEMYKVSDDWVMDKIREAGKTGYVELAFGLRLRTPILPQVIMDSDSMPFQAHKEIKTAGNALGQSYGLLNTRAGNEFMQRVWDSPYATSILPTCQIHDSLYFMIRNTLGTLKFVNDNLIECMRWNELEPIQHPEVKLEASLEVFHPDWAHPITLANEMTTEELQAALRAAQ